MDKTKKINKKLYKKLVQLNENELDIIINKMIEHNSSVELFDTVISAFAQKILETNNYQIILAFATAVLYHPVKIKEIPTLLLVF